MVKLKRVEEKGFWIHFKKGKDRPLVVALTGAGISAESGLSTFRDSGGLWEKYRIEEVATPEAWQRNPQLVLEFYNQRRAQLATVEPNRAHYALVDLESAYEVIIITQNVDDLHERAGSSKVLHLHGELKKVRSTKNPELIYDIGYEPIQIGDLCEEGSQLRPHVVWFHEPVPLFEYAVEITEQADIFLIIGTSLVVYPAASLVEYTRSNIPIYVIDPSMPALSHHANLHFIPKKATEGVPEVVNQLLEANQNQTTQPK
jgi:NAD-dependent deacetylase